jgi:D-tyrosyl-tRNA(Tyr) deacylase
VRVVLQRVTEASVTVAGTVTGRIGTGVLVLLGVGPEDTEEDCAWMAAKIAGLRIFPDGDGRMNRSLLDVGGGALVVSQFTLYGDCRKGRRPSFVAAAPPEIAEPVYARFLDQLRGCGVGQVQAGVFGAMMDVALHNDGPVTLVIDGPPRLAGSRVTDRGK